jgi:hypothetical protein
MTCRTKTQKGIEKINELKKAPRLPAVNESRRNPQRLKPFSENRDIHLKWIVTVFKISPGFL